MKNRKVIVELIEPNTGGKYTINKKLDKIKSVVTVSGKLEELKAVKFNLTF